MIQRMHNVSNNIRFDSNPEDHWLIRRLELLSPHFAPDVQLYSNCEVLQCPDLILDLILRGSLQLFQNPIRLSFRVISKSVELSAG